MVHVCPHYFSNSFLGKSVYPAVSILLFSGTGAIMFAKSSSILLPKIQLTIVQEDKTLQVSQKRDTIINIPNFAWLRV